MNIQRLRGNIEKQYTVRGTSLGKSKIEPLIRSVTTRVKTFLFEGKGELHTLRKCTGHKLPSITDRR